MMDGVVELAQNMFKTSSVRLGVPESLGGIEEDYRRPDFATVIGLVLANKSLAQGRDSRKRTKIHSAKKEKNPSSSRYIDKIVIEINNNNICIGFIPLLENNPSNISEKEMVQVASKIRADNKLITQYKEIFNFFICIEGLKIEVKIIPKQHKQAVTKLMTIIK